MLIREILGVEDMFNAQMTLFEINLPNIQMAEKNTSSMVVRGCNAYIGEVLDGNMRVYSEFEELNYAYLNNNDYNGKVFELEVCLQSNNEYIYSGFYARCFSIRCDNGLRIKLNGPINNKCYTKVNMNNQIVMGIGVFLSDEAYEMLQSAKIILIEGFFALEKVINTYGMAIKLEKKKEKYKVRFANTYRLSKKVNINGLAH